jgi:hypothetical protein
MEIRGEETRRGFGRREIGSAGQGREWGWIIHASTVLPTYPQEIMHRMLSEPFEDKKYYATHLDLHFTVVTK